MANVLKFPQINSDGILVCRLFSFQQQTRKCVIH